MCTCRTLGSRVFHPVSHSQYFLNNADASQHLIPDQFNRTLYVQSLVVQIVQPGLRTTLLGMRRTSMCIYQEDRLIRSSGKYSHLLVQHQSRELELAPKFIKDQSWLKTKLCAKYKCIIIYISVCFLVFRMLSYSLSTQTLNPGLWKVGKGYYHI